MTALAPRVSASPCARCGHSQEAHAGDKDCMCGACMWFVAARPSAGNVTRLTPEERAAIRKDLDRQRTALHMGGYVEDWRETEARERRFRAAVPRLLDDLETAESERDAALAEVARLRAEIEGLADKWAAVPYDHTTAYREGKSDALDSCEQGLRALLDPPALTRTEGE